MIYLKWFFNALLIIVVIASFMHIEFPFRKLLLYLLILCVLVVDVFIPLIKKRKKKIEKNNKVHKNSNI